MANEARSELTFAWIAIGIGLGATLFGVWRAVDGATVLSGSLWAGVACLVIGTAMYRGAQGRTLWRTLLFAVAGLALLVSLYSTFEEGRRHSRAQASRSATP